MARNIKHTFEISPPTESTIYQRVQAYADKAVKAVKDIKANTGDEWVADETMMKIDGHPNWLWNVMASKTRYILAAYLTPDRDVEAATKVMRMAKDAAADPPERIRTDRLKSYPPAIKAVFGRDSVERIQTDGIAALVNNNLAERLQGTIKERDKVLRGFKRSTWAQKYLDGWVLNYNFFRPHIALGGRATPASRANAKPPFFNWQDMARTVDAKVKVEKATRPRDLPEFKPKKKLGRPRTRPRGRGITGSDRPLADAGRPIDAPVHKSRELRVVAYSERPVMQKSLDAGKR